MKTRHEVWKEQEAAIAAMERDLDRAGKLLMSTDAAAGHGRAVKPKADGGGAGTTRSPQNPRVPHAASRPLLGWAALKRAWRLFR